MFGIEHYAAFVLAGILLNITPGADTFYILARSIGQGRLAGIVSVCGIGTGALVHIALAAFGLSTILASSATAYAIVRYAGAAYLVFIGIITFRTAKRARSDKHTAVERQSLFRVYYQGILTNLLNPKVALFFLSFLPQFVSPENAYGPVPFLILGFTFLITGSIWCFFLALSSSFMTGALRKKQRIARWLQRGCGAVFVGLGLTVALKN